MFKYIIPKFVNEENKKKTCVQVPCCQNQKPKSGTTNKEAAASAMDITNILSRIYLDHSGFGDGI